jgi:hypothetical protein
MADARNQTQNALDYHHFRLGRYSFADNFLDSIPAINIPTVVKAFATEHSQAHA